MYFIALAIDYDGTLAEHGIVEQKTLNALRRFKETGRKLILVTGRELADLKGVFQEFDLFERVVAENGALLYTPATEKERLLAPPPPQEFGEALRRRGVAPLTVGRSIVATYEPNQYIVLETIKEMGLELEIIFNKGAVMVLPSGINKASGLKAALEELQLSPLNVVAVGDAENDHALLRTCGYSAAVANALPALKDTADLVLKGEHGNGVMELVALVSECDAALCTNERHLVPVGKDGDSVIAAHPNEVLLIAGRSGIGKSTLATAITERLDERAIQYCIFDPEGDYVELEGAVTAGGASTLPAKDQVLELLSDPTTNVVVNTQTFELNERPGFFADLMPKIAALRARTGRPHWLIIDEAHHLMPQARDSSSLALSDAAFGTMMITVHPDSISADALKSVTTVVALGPAAAEVIKTFCAATGEQIPAVLEQPGDDQVLFWHRQSTAGVRKITVEKPRQSHKRHTRKYAQGRLDKERSFYFRGPDNELNLRAHNLLIFLQIADGVDDDTWEHHLRSGDFSKWFRERIGDRELAEETAAIERDNALSPAESRDRINEAVRRRYTAPASERE
jgi:HAD superfamily hydrolase (TIGR01484 family)